MYRTINWKFLNRDVTKELLRAVIQAGTQPTDIGKQYANVQLDQIMDCVRLFDR